MIKEYSAGAIIYRMEKGIRKYLLLHYTGGHWSFAKGHIEEGEKVIETVKRETLEETGIDDLKIIPDFEEHTDYYYKHKGKTFHKDVAFFLAETKKTKIILGSPWEHQGYDWFSYKEALNKLTFKNDKKILTKAEHLLKNKNY